MRVSFARVSSSGQHLDIQVTALTDAGCEKIYSEKVSGIVHRDQLLERMKYLRERDCLVIYNNIILWRKINLEMPCASRSSALTGGN